MPNNAPTPPDRTLPEQNLPLQVLAEIEQLRDFLHNNPVTVLKLGGSLFDLPDLATRLTRLPITSNSPPPLLLAGGGQFADVVRSLSKSQQLDPVAAHRLAIRSMELSAHFVAYLIPDARLVRIPHEILRAWERNQFPSICFTELFLATSALPASWDVTSDTLAAWLAWQHPDSELLLLKSVPLDASLSPDQAASQGLVDKHFPLLADQLKAIHWINLRDADLAPTRWCVRSHGHH